MNWLDSAIGYVSPRAGARRMAARMAFDFANASQRRYDAAGHGRRVADWKVGTNSANRELEMSLQRLIARSRDLDRNNPYAKRAVERIADNVIGTGIRPTFDKDNAKLKKAWKIWAEDTTECDYDGRNNFYGLQWIAERTVLESGGVLIRRRRTKNNTKSKVPLQLQVFEPDILDFSKNFDNPFSDSKNPGGYSIQGVEFDQNGQRVGYWMYDRYPSDGGMRSSLESKLIPAEDIAHVYVQERPGQVHGVPSGVQAFVRLRDFDEFEDAELVRQKIAACFSVFITESADSRGPVTSQNDLPEKVEPGTITRISPGEEMRFTNPPAKDGLESYARQVLRGIAAAYGMSYEALTGDLSNVNFSSARMGWIETQRMYSRLQFQTFVPNFCAPILDWFLEYGAIGMAFSVKDVTATWTPPRREMIDPTKEIPAMQAMVRNGFQDWGEAVTEFGFDPETVLGRIKKWNDEFDKNGVILDSDPRKTEGKGKFQVVPPDPSADPETGNNPPKVKKKPAE